jgi:hypothetical protein
VGAGATVGRLLDRATASDASGCPLAGDPPRRLTKQAWAQPVQPPLEVVSDR